MYLHGCILWKGMVDSQFCLVFLTFPFTHPMTIKLLPRSCQHTGCNKLWNCSDMALDLPIDTNILFGGQSQPMQAWPSLTYNVRCRLMLSHHPRPVHFCRKSFSETLFSTTATASRLRPSNFRLTIPIFFCGGIF